jgi:hypothetical protein
MRQNTANVLGSLLVFFAVPFVVAEIPPPDPCLFLFSMTVLTFLVLCLLDEEEERHHQALMPGQIARAIVVGCRQQRDGHDDYGVAQRRCIVVPWNHEKSPSSGPSRLHGSQSYIQ